MLSKISPSERELLPRITQLTYLTQLTVNPSHTQTHPYHDIRGTPKKSILVTVTTDIHGITGSDVLWPSSPPFHLTIPRTTVSEISRSTKVKEVSPLWIESPRENYTIDCNRWPSVLFRHKVVCPPTSPTPNTEQLDDNLDTVPTSKWENPYPPTSKR